MRSCCYIRDQDNCPCYEKRFHGVCYWLNQKAECVRGETFVMDDCKADKAN
jgi:hypothetical protein